MSILRKPYEISVWDDVWNSESNKFVEKRIGIIGTNLMTTQNRALEPRLTRNINGTKKFSFKMYRRYKDSITGEEVINPYTEWLVSERKIKLKYGTITVLQEDGTAQEKDAWYDFIVKNIVEDSKTYLYTYELEDANVQELSKNGFGVILDADLENNTGTARELAETVLNETDWKVRSHKFVQTIEDELVYLKISSSEFNTNYVSTGCFEKVFDQTDYLSGITHSKSVLSNLKDEIVVLAFYTSCKDRPHRFQFILLGQGTAKNYNKGVVSRDGQRFITVENCQYFLTINDIKDYEEVDGFYLPKGWSLVKNETQRGAVDKTQYDTLISHLYRGKRYGFSQQTKYIPLLDKYCKKYIKSEEDGTEAEYWGYTEHSYISPILLQDVIANSDFKSTAGWTGTHTGKNSNRATIETVYGRFAADKKFHSISEDLKSNKFNDNIGNYKAYLKVVFPASNSEGPSLLINDGFYENRTLIKNIEKGEKWNLVMDWLDEGGSSINNFEYALREVKYDPENDNYEIDTAWTNWVKTTNNKLKLTIIQDKIPDAEFAKKKIKLVTKYTSNTELVCYLTKASLYKDVQDSSGKNMQPGELDTKGIVLTEYKYIKADSLEGATDIKKLVVYSADELNYKTYQPVYIDGAEKVRMVTIKESNYFNILQQIGETFEAWVDLQIERDKDGAVTNKFVWLKGYAGVGEINNACFRYGVNLEGIQRTHESKELVTKLIVKDNSNELAEDGYCSIAKASANLTKENYIYNFEYFHSNGMLDAKDYVDSLYYDVNSKTGVRQAGYDIAIDGKYPDIDTETPQNLQNYFNRINIINSQMRALIDTRVLLQTEYSSLVAQKVTQEELAEAANNSIEDVQKKFVDLVGFSIDELPKDGIDFTNSQIQDYLGEYAEYVTQLNNAREKLDGSTGLIEAEKAKKSEITALLTQEKLWRKRKAKLNQLFYSKYCRFIQEGTWISEDYVDDNKYYADAQSVMYNSCYPQVVYSINVVSLAGLPGYELFDFEVGDKTRAEDPKFFGSDSKIEVVVSEMTEALDDPSQNKITVQNFKSHYQDLFQKITATVQQTQYSTGSYEKAVALTEANASIKRQFLETALNDFGTKLNVAGQTTVTQDEHGITLTDSSTLDSMRLIGGAILMSKVDSKTGERSWKTGLTPEGIAADWIGAGIIDANEVRIMNKKDPLFRWDSYGLTAFWADWKKAGSDIITIDKADPKQFVRFDKFGIYGISSKSNLDGRTWKPSIEEDITKAATFSLTWKGLKVSGGVIRDDSGNHEVVALLGKQKDYIMRVIRKLEGNADDNTANEDIFTINPNGDVDIAGNLRAGYVGGWEIKQTSNNNGIYEGSLTYGDLGKANSFHMYSNGCLTTDASTSNTYFGQSDNKTWALGIGENFGVTTNGAIHATAGIFGPLQIYQGTISDKNSGNFIYSLKIGDNAVLGPGVLAFGTKGSGTDIQTEGSRTVITESYFSQHVMEGAQESYINIGKGKVQIDTRSKYGGHLTNEGVFYTIQGKFDKKTNMGMYVVDDRLYLRCSEEGPEINLSDLVFKGPYNIKMGSVVIGKIAQLGPVVYGYIESSKFTTYTDNTTLSIENNNPKISGPNISGYLRVAIGYDSGKKSCQMNISNNNGTIQLVLTEHWNYTSSLGNCDGYFCYSVGTHSIFDGIQDNL